MTEQKEQTKHTKEEEPEVKQVYQGRSMRHDASFLSKLFFSYAWPLLECSMESRICFEQYGDLPEHLKIEHEEKKIEASI